MRQVDMILDYMRNVGGITQAQAVKEFGCYRLSARIWDLRHEGHTILKITRSDTNRYGDPVTFAEYRLVER